MDRSRGKALGPVLLMPLVLLAGCGSDDSAPALGDEYRDTLSISPDHAQPGDRLTVQLRKGAGAARHFALQEWDGEAWQDSYCLRSDAFFPPDEELPSAERPRLGGLGCLDAGLDMSQMTEHLRLPEALDPDIYRLCEAGSRPSGCALLEVKSPS